MNDRYLRVSNALQQKVGQRQLIVNAIEQLELQKTIAEANLTETNQARLLLELCLKSVEEKTKEYIEPVVTEALQFIFEQPLYFHLFFVSRRNQTEVDFILLYGEEVEQTYQKLVNELPGSSSKLEDMVKNSRNLSEMYGGAVGQVLGSILRFIIVELLHIRGPICLDEPSSAVHPVYATRFGQLISSLSEKFNRQYIIVTHSSELAGFADLVYEVRQINNISNVYLSEEVTADEDPAYN